MDLPFDGAISAYFKDGAPKPVRKLIEKGRSEEHTSELQSQR